jgi:hypothetical protein
VVVGERSDATLIVARGTSPAKHCGRHDTDTIRLAILERAGCHDDRVDEVRADLVGQPAQMTHVVVVGRSGELRMCRAHGPRLQLDKLQRYTSSHISATAGLTPRHLEHEPHLNDLFELLGEPQPQGDVATAETGLP